MSFKNYVCLTCAQDFTRKYSAYRHNRVLHQDQGKIVRTLEYIIGRVAGNYFSADPASFKRKRKQDITGGKSNGFPFTAVAHDGFRSHSFKQQEEHKLTQELGEPTKEYSIDTSVDTRASKIAEIKSLYTSLFSSPLRDTVFQLDVNKEGNECRLDDYLSSLRSVKACFQRGREISEKPDTWKGFHTPHQALFDLHLEARTMLIKIESLMLRCFDEVTVWNEIERLGNDFKTTGDWNILNVALDYYHRTTA